MAGDGVRAAVDFGQAAFEQVDAAVATRRRPAFGRSYLNARVER